VPEERIWEILDFLERNEFIESRGERWKATLFGYKTMTLYLDPLSALIMREALEGKRGSEFSYLHAICATPDMRCLYLGRKDEWVEQKANEEKILVASSMADYDFFLSEVKTACLLEDWINERKEDEIIMKYQVGPGDIHAKVETAEWLLHAMQELARLFNFDVVSMLSKLKLRVKHGCREELLNLVTLRGIGRVRARILYKNGFRSVEMLRKASVERLASLPGIGKRIAEQIKEQI
jgi:helicase